ncbi:MAG TPA: hypothetical protein VHN98_07275 [Acidimicrobiales bacterium]|nr:hypothetical protein [Acidimicrobiales bacterium]
MALVALAVAGLLAGGCGRRTPPAVVLDGRPRLPDVEGVVQQVSFTSVELDGGRRYRITRDLQCFSTSTLQAVPLLERQGQYVQMGVDHGRVVWMAAVGGVVPVTPPAVYYRGELVRVSRAGAVFRDGTVVALSPELRASLSKPSAARGRVLVRIDPARHVAVGITPS